MKRHSGGKVGKAGRTLSSKKKFKKNKKSGAAKVLKKHQDEKH